MILYFWFGGVIGAIVGYTIANILNISSKQGESENGED